MTSDDEHRIDSRAFYGQYHGHPASALGLLARELRKIGNSECTERPLLWLCGDSSLDNKYWLGEGICKELARLTKVLHQACNGYERLIFPAMCPPDVCYHLNVALVKSGYHHAAVNAAVEESTICMRDKQLLEQDQIVKDSLRENDAVVVSVGGNDIVLRPSVATMFNLFILIKYNGLEAIRKGPGSAWVMSYFVQMFKDDVKAYVRKLITKTKPKVVAVCMIYFPAEKSVGSWADEMLKAVDYNKHPEKVQEILRQVYKHATNEIKEVDGVKVVAIPLFDALDPRNGTHYVDRVEPSGEGGKLMAKLIIDRIIHNL